MSRKLIVYSDDDFLIAHKGPKLLTTPVEGLKEESLLDVLHAEGHKVLPIHRLDRDTTGLVVFAKNENSKQHLLKLFAARKVKKQYQALAQGWVTPKSGELNLSIRDLGPTACIARSGKPARTTYSTTRRVGPCSLLKIEIETGRHNQIRLHFAHMGHPLVGERRFALAKWSLLSHRRVLLHASCLVIPRKRGAPDLVVNAPLPDDFTRRIQAAERIPCSQDPGIMSSEGLYTTEQRQRQRWR